MADDPTWDLVLKRNSIERLKKEKAPLAVIDDLPALIDRGYEDIAEEDIVRFQWYGLYHDKPKIGFFMLRGWDQGYSVPAYGVTIDQRFRNRGLGRLTLELSRSICKLRGAAQLMLKVHPQNAAAKQLYESFGFVRTSIDHKNDNLVYHLDL